MHGKPSHILQGLLWSPWTRKSEFETRAEYFMSRDECNKFFKAPRNTTGSCYQYKLSCRLRVKKNQASLK